MMPTVIVGSLKAGVEGLGEAEVEGSSGRVVKDFFLSVIKPFFTIMFHWQKPVLCSKMDVIPSKAKACPE